MTPEWPSEERIDRIGANGNDGDHYALIAPHEDKEYRLVMGGMKPLGTIEKAKDPNGFAMAVSLGNTGTLHTKLVNTEDGAEVAFVKPGYKHLLDAYLWLLAHGVAKYGIKEYHRKMGRLYGYSPASIEEFINAEISCDCHKCKGK